MEKSKDIHILGITTKKEDDFADWYQQIMTKCKMIDYYDVSGCYILLPNAYFVWEQIQNYLNTEFRRRGVQNVYFPLLITKRNLEREADHLEGFSPEVAWVTKTGDKSLTMYADDDKEKKNPDERNHLAIRPTSECAIYANIGKQIQSYHDLPLKYNQWANVVRWEFKDATPFIRSREFLWQEGHTAFRTEEEAVQEVEDIINLYQETYKNVLAIPTIKGQKTRKERFAGALNTLTLEGFIPEVGRGIQACTAHNLGQNFSKMFDIQYNDADKENKCVWQNSWGFTTRSIGVAIMTHGDNKGMIFPPYIAPIQMVIIPIVNKKTGQEFSDYVRSIESLLGHHFRVHVDNTEHKPGWKHNHWEVMGVPLKIEIGPREVKNKKIMVKRRDNGNKNLLDVNDELLKNLGELLQDIHINLYNLAKEKMDNCVTKPKSWIEFKDNIQNNKMCLIPWCNNTECEDSIYKGGKFF